MAIGQTTASNPISGLPDPYKTNPYGNLGQQTIGNPYQQNQAPAAATGGGGTQPGQFSMMQDNNQIVPLQKSAYNQATQQPQTTQQGNDAVLQSLQSKVLNQQSSPINGMVQDRTAQLLQDPNMGYNPQQFNQNQLEQYDREASQAMEAARQKLADTSQSGELQNEFLRNALTVAQGRGDLSKTLDYETMDRQQKNLIDALAEGRSTMKAQSDDFTSMISNLATARGAAEGERAQTSSQDFAAGQAALDRAQQLLVQANDIEGQKALTELKGKIDQGLQLSAQDFEASQSALNRSLQTALQANDLAATKENLQTQLAFDKWKTEAGFEFTAAQNAINNALQITMQTNDIEANKALAELKSKADMDMLLTSQDFDATQANLDRLQKDALSRGDWANALELETLRGQIDAQAQKSQQEYQTAERVATQSWTTTERLGVQEFQTGLKYIDQELAIALQNNDYQNQKSLADDRAALELQMQTNDMGQQEKMAFLNAQLEDARANNDLERQKQILTFQHTQNLETMAQQFGYDAALTSLKAQLDESLANNDFTNSMSLLNAQQKFTASESAKDRVLEEARIALQGREIEMQGQALTFEQIQAAVDAGQIDADAAVQAVQTAASKYGITISAPNPDAVYQELQKQYKVQEYQYALSHPEDANYDANGNFVSLKETAVQGFNDYLNETYYGSDGKPIIGGDPVAQTYRISANGQDKILGADGQIVPTEKLVDVLRNADQEGNANYDRYQELVANAKVISPRIVSASENTIDIGADQGDVVSSGGRLFVVTKGNWWNTDGRNHGEFEIMDLATGTKRTFTGLSSGDNSVRNFDSWVATLQS